MAQSVSDSLLPVLARTTIAAVFLWMGTVKLFGVGGGLGFMSRGDMSSLGMIGPILVVLELGGGIVFLIGSEVRRAALVLLAALALEYLAVPSADAGGAWLAGRADPAVVAMQRAAALAGALLLAVAYETNQARPPRENDTSFGLVALLGRWCIGGMIALTAVRDIADFGAAARALGEQGVPAAEVTLAADVALRLVAGWALIIGFWTRLAALVLLAHAAIAYNPLLQFYRVYVGGDARSIALAQLALGLVGGLVFAFLQESERRVPRDRARPAAPAARPGS